MITGIDRQLPFFPALILSICFSFTRELGSLPFLKKFSAWYAPHPLHTTTTINKTKQKQNKNRVQCNNLDTTQPNQKQVQKFSGSKMYRQRGFLTFGQVLWSLPFSSLASSTPQFHVCSPKTPWLNSDLFLLLNHLKAHAAHKTLLLLCYLDVTTDPLWWLVWNWSLR